MTIYIWNNKHILNVLTLSHDGLYGSVMQTIKGTFKSKDHENVDDDS